MAIQSLTDLKALINSTIQDNTTNDISGSDVQTALINAIDTLDSLEGFINVHKANGQTTITAYGSKALARAAVPDDCKKEGVVIAYKISTGWLIEQNLDATAGTWGDDASWQTIGPVSVSQNTETGHTEIHIGSDDYPVASIEDFNQLSEEVNGLTYDIILEKYINPQGLVLNTPIGFYTTPIQVRAGDVIIYSIKGVDCAILSIYADETYYPIVVAGNTEETFVDAVYNVTDDGYIVFSGAIGTLKVSRSMSRIDYLESDVDSLKTNVEELRSEVDNLATVNVEVINDRYIDPQGEIGISYGAFYTEPIFLKQGERITYSIRGIACAILSTYNLGEYTPIVIAPSDHTETYTDETYTAPTDVFVVFCGEENTFRLQKISSVRDNADRIEHLEDVVNVKPFIANNGKYITPAGTIATSSIGFYTEPIFLKQGEIIKFSINAWACSVLSLYNNGEYTPLLISNIGDEETLTNIKYQAPQDEYVVFSGTPNTLVLVSSISTLNERLSALENKENSISVVSYGGVKNDGSIDGSVRTSLLIRIEGGKGFYIKLNPGFRFTATHLYDDNSNERLQSYFCGGTNDWIPFQNDNYSSFGQDTVIAGQHLLLVVSKSDNSTISGAEFNNVIKTFCYLNDARLHRWVLEDEWFLFAHKRMRCLANTQWKALEYVKPITNTFAAYRFLKGENYIGVPYSDVSEKNKYIGVQVSPYTFVTAAANKRSVVYTEDINPNSPHSEYDIVYNVAGQSACHCFYGSVCSGFTAAIMGLPLVYLVSSYNGGTYPVPNLTTIVNANANNVKPLDLIYYQGHISIISDIYKDDYGKVKYILWAEYNYPNVWINVYTPEEFEERLSVNDAVVRRYSDWANTCTDINIPDCVPAEFNDYARILDIEKNLHVFTGDKSAFSMDDPIYLNINRTPGYTTLLVYKDNAESPTFTIDISGLEPDDLYPTDTDDWCIYNMRLQTLTYGKYKARLSDGNGNYSGYVYFEIIDSNASLNIENGIITSIEFTASNATPIAVVTCDQNYYQKAVKIPTSSEIENKEIALNWNKSSALYLNLLLRGDYGVVYKRFALSSL